MDVEKLRINRSDQFCCRPSSPCLVSSQSPLLMLMHSSDLGNLQGLAYKDHSDKVHLDLEEFKGLPHKD